MAKVIVINGSPRKSRGNTGRLLKPFIDGMAEAGADVEVIYPSAMQVKPCSCGTMYCWDKKPGVCCVKDEMQDLYPRLAAASILVLASPMYIPLPGDMQNVINRLCPLIEPSLTFQKGRTRAKFREHVSIRKIALVATSGWWEKENLETLTRIVQEIAEDVSVTFSGAVIRPHADCIRHKGIVTPDGQAVLDAAKLAGRALIEQEHIPGDLLESISRPLVSAEDWFHFGK